MADLIKFNGSENLPVKSGNIYSDYSHDPVFPCDEVKDINAIKTFSDAHIRNMRLFDLIGRSFLGDDHKGWLIEGCERYHKGVGCRTAFFGYRSDLDICQGFHPF
jgi:hypothetical protein